MAGEREPPDELEYVHARCVPRPFRAETSLMFRLQRQGNSRTCMRKPRLVFFYSRQSGRSRRAEGFLAQVLQRRRNFENFDVYRVDTNDRPDLSERLHVERVPTLVVLEDKRVRARLEEPRGCADIEETLKPWLR